MRTALRGAFVGIGLTAAALAVFDCVGDAPAVVADAGGDSSSSSESSTGADGGACAARAVNEATGIFVDINGADSEACGARSQPCQTLQTGIDHAKLLGRATVYVARGTYRESISLAAGVTLEGGWDTLGAQWVPICGADQISAVKIQMPDAASNVVRAEGAGAMGLRLVSVLGKDKVARGESVYGVFARDSEVTLESVVVTLGAAGNGNDGNEGAAGGDGGTKCAPGDGAAGGAAAPGAGAQAGTFASTGYVAAAGADGASDGGTGGAGGCALSSSCVTVCTPNECASRCKNSLAGCGGGPGAGGAGGQGGGSSIAVFGWNAKFRVVGGSFTAGNGGNGGNGGAGGPGGSGGSGAVEQELCQTCINDGGGCATVGDMTLATGGGGGRGGAGGGGGGGAGGFSYAIYAGGEAGAVKLEGAPALSHESAGAGGSAHGAAGKTGTVGP